MKTELSAPGSRSLHPLAWVAGIALILFSGIGIGALMGWIPTSISGPPDKARLDAQTAAKPQPKAKAPSAAPLRQSEPAKVASSAPARSTSIKCVECGVIESVREVDTKGTGSGIGVVGGAVLGGVLGNQVGGGRGKDVMTVVGAVGGAIAGNEVEKRVKSTKSYAITVRFDDGSSRVISEANAPSWRAGDKVKIVNGLIHSNA